MATIITSSLSTPIRASSGSESRKLDPARPRPAAAAAASPTANWWTPLFGWPSDPDYMNNSTERKEPGTGADPDMESYSGRARSRFALGCFTEEKAKQLRKKTMESSTFHDVMNHSAIASRLASEASVGSEK